MTRRLFILSLSVSLSAAAALIGSSALTVVSAADGPTRRVEIKTLSADAARVTGGDVLTEILLPASTPRDAVKVTASGRDVTSDFRPGAARDTLVGLITGLANGKSTLAVRTKA